MNAFAPLIHTVALSRVRQPELKTGRLVLRNVLRTDRNQITRHLGDFDVARMLMPVPQPYDHNDADSWLDCWDSGAVQGWCFAITVQPDLDILRGVVSIEWKPDQQCWSMGYWLGRPDWGQGFMSEAVNAVCEAFFGRLIGATLHSGVIADNPASLKVQRKLGFDIAGVKDVWCVPRGEMVKLIETEVTFGGFMPL